MPAEEKKGGRQSGKFGAYNKAGKKEVADTTRWNRRELELVGAAAEKTRKTRSDYIRKAAIESAAYDLDGTEIGKEAEAILKERYQ